MLGFFLFVVVGSGEAPLPTLDVLLSYKPLLCIPSLSRSACTYLRRGVGNVSDAHQFQV